MSILSANNIKSFSSLTQILQASLTEERGIIFIGTDSSDVFLSYTELYDRALKVLYKLQVSGIKPGSELVFQLEDNMDFLLTFWACVLGGIIPVPVTIGANEEHRDKLFRIWRVLNAPALVIAKSTIEKMQGLLKAEGMAMFQKIINGRLVYMEDLKTGDLMADVHEVKGSETALIQFSSGSTGNPKGVVLTHENLIININAILKSTGATQDDSSFGWMPLTHDLGLIGFHLAPLAARVNQYIMPPINFIRNPIVWMDKVDEYKITMLASPNFGYKHFLTFLEANKNKTWDLSHVRLIFNGAEPISAELSDYFYNVMSRWGLSKNAAFPVYGLAEASLAVTIPPAGEGLRKIDLDRDNITVGNKIIEVESGDSSRLSFVDLGYPVEGCSVKICDWDNHILPENYVGLIYIKGGNVTKGYYNNEEETKRILSEDGWLNTGDLGFMGNGRLYVTGRAKDIIFINGQNYYPHDLERIAGEVPGAEAGKTAMCGAYNLEKQKEEIIAFVQFQGTPEEFVDILLSLKKHINVKTGLDVTHVVPVADMPKTASGKVQRFKLKEEYEQGKYNLIIKEAEELAKAKLESREIVAPTNEMEMKLAQIWSEILGIENIGIMDNFFELGGDSLKATYIAAKIYMELGIEVPLNELFNEPTIKALAECAATAERVEYVNIPIIKESEYYPLSSAQKRMYILNELDKDDISYNITHVVKINGGVDKLKLEAAIKSIISRHESLRTYFEVVDGQPVQKILKEMPFGIEYLEANEKNAEEIVRGFVKPFDLSKAPLFRAALIEVENKEQLLVLDAHHIIFDGSSMAILFDEFIQLYQGGNPKETLIQYKDYVSWYNEKLDSEELKYQEQYWLKLFEGEIPQLTMPEDFNRPAVQSYEGDKLYFRIDKATAEQLKQLAYKTGTSMYMVMLAAYYVLLHKYTGQEDIVVGTPTAGRSHPELHRLIGMFVNTLPLRNQVKGDMQFVKLLSSIKQNTLDAFNNQDYQFEKLVDKLELKRDMGHNPLFDTMFVFQNMMLAQTSGSDLEFAPYKYKNNISKFDLTLFAQWDKDEIDCEMEYCTKLFKADTIARLIEHYQNILNEIAIGHKKRIYQIEMLSQTEKQQFMYEYNNKKAEYPYNKTMHELFQEQAERTPDNIAVVCEDNTLTYKELNERVNVIARRIRQKGIGSGSIAAIMLERSTELIISILAVLKAGGAYLPIDLGYPQDRISFMLEDSGAHLIISQPDIVKNIEHTKAVLTLDSNETYEDDINNLDNLNTADDLIYIIYTSGSTGKPKGVALPHKAATNYITWAAKSYVKGEKASFPLYTSVSFDLTVTSIFTPLLTGNSIVIYKEDEKKLPIERILEDNKVEIIKLTPAHLKLIKDMDLSSSRVRRLIVGGEQLETKLAQKVYEAFNKNVEIYNEYGPTEAAVGCMIYKYDPLKNKRTAVPIGVPADNMEIYILDKYLNIVPYNVIGEMYIGGAGLAKGYLNRADLTEERFVSSPFRHGERMYKTGDLARLMTDGNMEYIGRVDHQVKIRGYRIEIGEIENKLLQHQAVKEALVISKADEEGNNYLCAYVVPDNTIENEDLRRFLGKELPEYMVPSYFMHIDSIPLTANGKVDTKALPEPKQSLVREGIYQAPENDIQRKMAEAWQAVLGVQHIGINDNYFSLGGDSIKAIQISSKLSQMGISVNIKDILTYQTISDLCLNVDITDKDNLYSQDIMSGSAELLPIHHWFFKQAFVNPDYYNQSVLLKLNQDIKESVLKEAFNKILEHHDSLRLNYDKENHKLFYNNSHMDMGITLDAIEIHDISEDKLGAAIEAAGSKLKSGFDIEKGLLIKAALINAKENGSYLLITAHHIIVDGVSWMIILEDLFKTIQALEEGVEVALPKKTASIKDWNEGLLKYMQSNQYAEQIEYWGSISKSEFCIQKDCLGINESDSSGERGTIKENLTEENTQKLLTECHKTYNTEINDLLMTALVRAIQEMTGKSQMIVELEGHGRNIDNIDVSRTIGWFTAMYPVMLTVSSTDMGNQIKEVKEQLRTIPNAGMGYGLYKYLNEESHNTHRDITEIRFNYLGQYDNLLDNKLAEYSSVSTGAEISTLNHMTANIEINCMVINRRFEIDVAYNKGLFSEERVSKFTRDFVNSLNEVIHHTINENDIYFTPSDFETLDIDQEDLDSLFL